MHDHMDSASDAPSPRHLDRWLAARRGEVLAALRRARLGADPSPALFDDLVRLLADPAAETPATRAHARRALADGRPLPELIADWSALRAATLEVLEADAAATLADARRLDLAIERSSAARSRSTPAPPRTPPDA